MYLLGQPGLAPSPSPSWPHTPGGLPSLPRATALGVSSLALREALRSCLQPAVCPALLRHRPALVLLRFKEAMRRVWERALAAVSTAAPEPWVSAVSPRGGDAKGWWMGRTRAGSSTSALALCCTFLCSFHVPESNTAFYLERKWLMLRASVEGREPNSHCWSLLPPM